MDGRVGGPLASRSERELMNDPTTIAAILSALAAGDDPFTGLRLTNAQILEDPRVRAALAAAAERLDPDMRLSSVRWVDTAKRTTVEGATSDDYSRKGKAWTSGEQARLIEAFALELPIADIAKDLGRTRGAISSRLVMLGLKSAADTPKGNERFLRHFEQGQMLPHTITANVMARASRLLAAEDPEHASERLEAALAKYAADEKRP